MKIFKWILFYKAQYNQLHTVDYIDVTANTFIQTGNCNVAVGKVKLEIMPHVCEGFCS